MFGYIGGHFVLCRSDFRQPFGIRQQVRYHKIAKSVRRVHLIGNRLEMDLYLENVQICEHIPINS